jgi:hypothetical protein
MTDQTPSYGLNDPVRILKDFDDIHDLLDLMDSTAHSQKLSERAKSAVKEILVYQTHG